MIHNKYLYLMDKLPNEICILIFNLFRINHLFFFRKISKPIKKICDDLIDKEEKYKIYHKFKYLMKYDEFYYLDKIRYFKNQITFYQCDNDREIFKKFVCDKNIEEKKINDKYFEYEGNIIIFDKSMLLIVTDDKKSISEYDIFEAERILYKNDEKIIKFESKYGVLEKILIYFGEIYFIAIENERKILIYYFKDDILNKIIEYETNFNIFSIFPYITYKILNICMTNFQNEIYHLSFII